jgi:hypothetical protein
LNNPHIVKKITIRAFFNRPGYSLTDFVPDGMKMDNICWIQNIIDPLATPCHSNSGQAPH